MFREEQATLQQIENVTKVRQHIHPEPQYSYVINTVHKYEFVIK